MSNLAKRRGFGDWKDQARKAIPVAIGGVSALALTSALRGFAAPGSVIERHAGLFGMLGGIAVSVLSKQGGIGIGSAVVVGGGIELVEILTEAKMVS